MSFFIRLHIRVGITLFSSPFCSWPSRSYVEDKACPWNHNPWLSNFSTSLRRGSCSSGWSREAGFKEQQVYFLLISLCFGGVWRFEHFNMDWPLLRWWAHMKQLCNISCAIAEGEDKLKVLFSTPTFDSGREPLRRRITQCILYKKRNGLSCKGEQTMS